VSTLNTILGNFSLCLRLAHQAKTAPKGCCMTTCISKRKQMEASHHLSHHSCLLWLPPPLLAWPGQGNLHSHGSLIACRGSDWNFVEACGAAKRVVQWHVGNTSQDYTTVLSKSKTVVARVPEPLSKVVKGCEQHGCQARHKQHECSRATKKLH